MDLVQAVILALIQGITEFLPISSSAHLILPSQLLGWPDQGLAFDVAVHVGTLAAVIAYFREDIFGLICGWLGQFGPRGLNENGRLAWLIMLATMPAGLAGLLFNDFIETHLRSSLVIAITTIFFGALLWWSDSTSKRTRDIAEMTVMMALIIGCAQALALIPGTSRSGITITAALFLGMTRVASARFSFLVSVPIILLSGGYKALELLEGAYVDWFAVGLATLVSAISAYICIHFFLQFITRLGMLPFVIYRFVLGAVLLGLLWI